ncbi:hypothetical protein K492DRAFT_172180 [Lichtheimia hyalospora FSU 10163]|nr:hypothetical protein K492DRAFT_172180 [Lichtheimia hyalospora FSU 10163]
MSPQKTRHNARKPRLFQCTGYGDCHMVFTRSEHLARHARKHTGEKPFKCIMPDCNKMFSRFDNMMQHTQTHRSSASNNVGNSYQRSQRRRRTRINSIDTTSSTMSSSNDSIDSATVSSPTQLDDGNKRRRLSIAELCNPSSPSSSSWPMSPTTPTDDMHHHENKIKLTADEMEALQALGTLHTTHEFFESLHDMITGGPSGNACACL